MQHGLTNPEQGGALRTVLFLLVLMTTGLAVDKHIERAKGGDRLLNHGNHSAPVGYNAEKAFSNAAFTQVDRH